MSFNFNDNLNGNNAYPATTAGQGKVSLSYQTLPFLKDHGFQDMVVLPGSMYIELAAQEYQKSFGEQPNIFRNISFERIFLVPEKEPQSLAIHLEQQAGMAKAIFHNLDDNPRNNPYARLELSHGSKQTSTEDCEIEDLQQNIPSVVEAETHYHQLLANGNQYGPSFKVLGKVHTDDHQAFGKVILTADVKEGLSTYYLHPVLMDACIQILAGIKKKLGKTFILKGYKEINVISRPTTDFYCHAVLQESGDLAEIRAYDLQGNLLIVAKGVEYEYVENNSKPQKKQQTVNLAATFTVDPIKEPLEFWGRKLQMPLQTEFAPYNQVFQQLLDPSSGMYQENGVNVILINLEDWAETRHTLRPHYQGEELEQILQGKEQHILPNGLTVAHLNKYETEYVFTEIFLDKSYLKHGITINDGDVIFDIGANIGLFTMFVNQQCKDPEVYSFEPSPQVYSLLEANAKIYGKNSTAYNVGVSDKKKEAEFTFYEKSSVFSSFNANEELDRDAIRAVVHNMVKDSIKDDSEALDQFVDEMMDGRMQSKHFTCQLVAISDIIDENGIDHIDLLKIDAEKSELEIIYGIRDEHWDIIKQIVLEVHDTEGPVIKEVREILTAKGFEFHIEEETFLHNSGLFNIFAVRPGAQQDESSQAIPIAQIEENIDTLCSAIADASQRSGNPFLIISCPPSPEATTKNIANTVYEDLQQQLISQLQDVDNAYAIEHQKIAEYYPVENYFDSQQNELGHIPYSEEYFTALGTMVARNLRLLKSSPYKVIALDCDNTLWSGVVGEDGVEGIKLSKEHLYLQEFVTKQVANGMLVCLVSKNTEKDVLDVFENRQDMVLKMDNIVSTRINWEAKSQNLDSLAQELNLGLDSFIFIDDNPVECAEVSANCPGVLTLQLPSNSEEISQFLNHVWAFDHLNITDEDRLRTKMYQQNVQRESYRSKALSLEDFLQGLNLQITLEDYQKDNLGRISQLTQRTNQFNFSTVRRSENEIQDLINSGARNIFTVRVTDRFGDYGLVGVAIYAITADALEVDTMLLSCRVLGKGVEHRMIRELGEVAADKGLTTVRIPFVQTIKNEPALKFLQAIGSAYEKTSEAGIVFDLPVSLAKEMNYEVPKQVESLADKASKTITPSSSRIGDEHLPTISLELSSVSGIYQAIKTESSTKTVNLRSDVSTDNYSSIEKQILEVWEGVLGVRGISNEDNFFDIGGTSLKGVQVIALVNQKLQCQLSIVNLFESPTISLLAGLFTDEKSAGEQAVEASKERGRKRRDLRARRRKRR